MGKLFGGGDDAKKAAEQARKDSALSRQLQAVSNDQQLAQVQKAELDTGASRKASRGRRLFVTDAGDGGLATTLGG
ncbi:hypothetical protein [Aureimonas sp. AU12]|uniref:hypothetical protein n=1 Tax=Aureimonas sp. AU12 TaxID=1638161 RepID=UPI0007822FCA|nr:hypothetical protein [Aureimonas sp. AU12]